MPGCIHCGARTERARRTSLERLTTRAVYLCRGCGARTPVYRSIMAMFQSRCVCPLCGNTDLTKLAALDRIDKLTANPVRLLFGVLRAPLYHCTFCRYQFYDPRRPGAAPVRKPVALNSRQ